MAARSNGNGSRPAERLAAALKPTYDVEEVAVALQGCMDSATHAAAQEVKRELAPRLDKVDARLDKQDGTLRMIWKQCRGDPNQRLPIDD